MEQVSCLSCGGSSISLVHSGKWICDYCGSTYIDREKLLNHSHLQMPVKTYFIGSGNLPKQEAHGGDDITEEPFASIIVAERGYVVKGIPMFWERASVDFGEDYATKFMAMLLSELEIYVREFTRKSVVKELDNPYTLLWLRKKIASESFCQKLVVAMLPRLASDPMQSLQIAEGLYLLLEIALEIKVPISRDGSADVPMPLSQGSNRQTRKRGPLDWLLGFFKI